MPIHRVMKNGKIVGYQWGSSGKVYRTKKDAIKQQAAAHASGYKNKEKGKKK